MWYLSITETKPAITTGDTQAEQLDEHTVPVAESERANTAASPGSEYWLP